MAKDRKKKKGSGSPQNRPAVVHRYSAEDEEKKDKRKKLKIKSIIALVALGIAAGIGLLANFLLF